MSLACRLVWNHRRHTWIVTSETSRRKGKRTGTRTALNIVATALLIAGTGQNTAFAAPTQTYTWDGGAGTSNWSDAANWNPDGLPSSGVGCGSCYDLLIFGDAAGGTLYDDVGWAYELQVNAGSGAYNLAGSQQMETYGITNQSSNLLTVSMSGLSLSFHNTTWDAGNGGLSVSSPLSFMNADSLTVQGTADTTLSGSLSHSGPFSSSIIKEGSGTLHLSGTGTDIILDINQGSVSADSNTSLNNMRLAITTGTLLNINSSSVSVGNISGDGGEIDLGSNTLTLTNNTSTSYAGKITGPGGKLVKTGTGTLTLSGSNTYSGGTSLSGGTISVSSNSNLGNSFGGLSFNGGSLQTTASFMTTRTTTLSSGGGTFNVDASTTLTHAGAINGTGGLTKSGDGILLLMGSNNYTGGTTVTSGRLRNGSAGGFVDNTDYTVNGGTLELIGYDLTMSSLSGTGGSIVLGGTTLTVNQSSDTSYDGSISNTGSLVKSGSGTLTLGATNSYTGGTTVSGGTLLSGVAGAFVDNTDYTVNGGTLDLNNFDLSMSSLFGSGGDITLGSAALTVDQSSDTSYAGSISGTGGFTKNGSGTLTLTGANSYNGGTTLTAGTLRSGAAGAFIDNTDYTVDGGNLDLNSNDLTMSSLSGSGGSVTLGSATLTVNQSGDTSFNGNISGTGNLAKSGSGTLALGASNSYTGGTTLTAGTLRSGAAGAFIDNTDYTVNGGNLDLNNFDLSMSSLSGSGGDITLGSAALTVDQSSNTSYAGSISGTGGFSKNGSGSLTLSGSNTYSGGTELVGGTLSISSDSNLGNSGDALTLNGGTLQTTATTNINRTTTLNSGGGTFNVDASTTLTHNGTLNGTGGLTKSGDGTLVLADSSNSYSGTTTVTAGTLQNALGFVDNTDYIVNGGILDVNGHDLTMSSLSGSGGSVTLGSATLTVNQSGDTSFNGNIYGTGSLTKSGSGTLTLGAGNSYTAGTTVSGGTLQSGVAGAFADNTDYTVNGGTLDLNNFDLSMSSLSGSGGGITLGSAALTVDQSSNTSYAGSISGTGGFSKNGSGTLTLSGSNTYSGGTELVGGTLSISSDSNLGNSADTLTLNGGTLQTTASFATVRSTTINSGNGTFDISGSTTLTHSGSISGSGALDKTGSGTLALTGSNSYSGGTTVSAGTLLGNTDSLLGNITNNANVVFGQAADGTYAGDMDGSGSLSKIGAGTLYLTGSNTYTGPSTIDNGTLSVNGATTSATTVNAGGTLQGSGTVGSVTLNGGTVAPGNSIGTLNVSGDIDYSGGGSYQVEVDDAGNSDKIIASGTATLTGSSVEVMASNGSYNYSNNYTILTASGINGTFDSVSSNLAFLDPSLSYDSNNAYLTLTRNDVSFGDVGETKNQRAVSNSLSAIASSSASGGDMQTLLNAVTTLTTSGAQQAYDSLSGVQHANTQTLLLSANDRFSNLLSVRSNSLAADPGRISNQAAFTPARVAYNGDLSGLQLASNGTDTGLVKTQGSGFWLTPRGGTGSIEDTANASGLDYNWYGLYGGADKWLDNHRLVGFAFGASHVDANPVAGDSTINSLELAAYGRWQDEQRYFDASLNAGQQRTDTSRQVTVGPLSRTASADYDSQSIGLGVEAGQTLYEQEDQRMTPFIGLHYARLRRDGFAETGAGSANLVVDSETQESLQGRLGIRAAQHRKTESGRTLDWDVSVAWARELKDTASTLMAGLDGASSATFNIDGPELKRNRVQLGIGLTTDIGQSTTLRFGYDGELASSHQSHTVNATLSMTW